MRFIALLADLTRATELLVQMAEHHGLSCPHLIAYSNNRDKLIKQSGLTKKDFKALFYSAVLYHPQCTEDQLKRKLKTFDSKSEPPCFIIGATCGDVHSIVLDRATHSRTVGQVCMIL